jgi:uncharacterized membrane protein YbaN (DUF454 family)
MKWVHRLTGALGLNDSPRLRKLVVGVIGGTVLLVGIVLVFLPGPSSIVIPVGFLILASEFAWARRVLRRGKMVVEKARSRKWWEKFFRRGES